MVDANAHFSLNWGWWMHPGESPEADWSLGCMWDFEMSEISGVSDIRWEHCQWFYISYAEAAATCHRIRAKRVSPPGKATGVSVQLSLGMHERTGPSDAMQPHECRLSYCSAGTPLTSKLNICAAIEAIGCYNYAPRYQPADARQYLSVVWRVQTLHQKSLPCNPSVATKSSHNYIYLLNVFAGWF